MTQITARGELYTIPPAGYDIDELGGWLKSSDEAVIHAIKAVFDKYPDTGGTRLALGMILCITGKPQQGWLTFHNNLSGQFCT